MAFRRQSTKSERTKKRDSTPPLVGRQRCCCHYTDVYQSGGGGGRRADGGRCHHTNATDDIAAVSWVVVPHLRHSNQANCETAFRYQITYCSVVAVFGILLDAHAHCTKLIFKVLNIRDFNFCSTFNFHQLAARVAPGRDVVLTRSFVRRRHR